MKNSKIALFIISILVVSMAFGGTGKSVGTYGALELTIPTGAKGVALSESNLAVIGGADAMFYNPAGIARLMHKYGSSIIPNELFGRYWSCLWCVCRKSR